MRATDADEARVLLPSLALVCLGAFWLRLTLLGQPMRQDEADTVVLFALTPLRHILVDTAIPNNHILHSIMVKASVGLFGLDPRWVRLPAFLAGIALVPLTYRAGQLWYGGRAGLVAAALVAVSAPLVLYSTNARGYTLIAAASLVGLLGVRAALDHGSTRGWIAYALALSGGAAVNPSMLYPAGGIGLWALLELWRRPGRWAGIRELVRWSLIAMGLVFIAYLPALKVSGWRSVVANDYVRPMPLGRFLGVLPEFARDFGAWSTAGWPMALAVIVALAMILGWVRHRDHSADRVPGSLVMVAWAIVLLLLMRRAPFLRVFLYLVPVAAITAAAAIAWWTRRLRIPVLAVATLSVGVVALVGSSLAQTGTVAQMRETGAFPDAAAVAESLAVVLQPGDAVAALWRAQGPVDFYLRQRGIRVQFTGEGAQVTGRLYVVPAHDLKEGVASVIAGRKLRNVNVAGATVIAEFPASALWRIDPVVPDATLERRQP